MDGLRGDDTIAELCRREGIVQSLYYKWSKDFMEAGKSRLGRVFVGNTIVLQRTLLAHDFTEINLIYPL